jgi:hypothetical protein
MRAKEIIESAGATCAGGIATVAMPMGSTIRRTGGNLLSGKYMEVDLPTVSTPKKKGKTRAK